MSRENEKAHQLLIRKAEQVRNASEILLEKTRDWQVIKQFMSSRLSEIKLTDEQERKMERYVYINAQLSGGKYSKAQVISQLMNEKIFGVSMAQAYEDLRCTAELFTSAININKQYEINLLLEIAKMAQAKCHEIFDFKGGAMYARVIKDLIAMLPDEELHPGEDFEGHEIEAVFNPLLLGAPAVDMKEVLKAINEKRKVKINIDMFDDIEIVKDEKADPL